MKHTLLNASASENTFSRKVTFKHLNAAIAKNKSQNIKNLKKGSLLILWLLLFLMNGIAQVTKGLVAYYPFKGNANDVSGNNNNGTITGGVSPAADQFSRQGNAFLFDGKTGYILIPNSLSLKSQATTNAITQTAWIYLNGNSLVGDPFCPVFMKSNQVNNQFMYRLGVSTGSIFADYNNWYTGTNTPYVFNLHTWYFIATTFDGSIAKTYINHVLINSLSLNTTIPVDNLPLMIGKDAPGYTEIFNGIIDEVRIYNRAISQSEIDTLSNFTKPGIFIGDKGISEGNSGTQSMNFRVTLSNEYASRVSVRFTTADMTATAGSDYLATAGTLRFQPGQTSKTITVLINGDTQPESNEKFKVTISNPVDANITDGLGIGTVRNDDGASVSAQQELVTTENITVSTAKSMAKIWPNPATSFFNVELTEAFANDISVQLVSTTGNILHEWKYASTKQTVQQLNTAGIANGVYMLVIKDDKGNRQSERIIISR